MMLVLDISNYGRELTTQVVADWKAAGVEKVVVGIDLRAANIGLARRQLAVARDGGMRLGAYREAYWKADVESTLALVKSALSGFDIEDMGIAFEDRDAPLVGYSTQELVCAWIQHNLDVASRYWPRTLYYGAAWWHNPYTGNTTRFSGWPLWVADYNGLPDGTFRPFGGWTACYRHQFLGSTDFCHYSADLNYEEGDMADTEARQKIAILQQQESLKAAISENNMAGLLDRLAYFGVIRSGVGLLKPKLDGK